MLLLSLNFLCKYFYYLRLICLYKLQSIIRSIITIIKWETYLLFVETVIGSHLHVIASQSIEKRPLIETHYNMLDPLHMNSLFKDHFIKYIKLLILYNLRLFLQTIRCQNHINKKSVLFKMIDKYINKRSKWKKHKQRLLKKASKNINR